MRPRARLAVWAAALTVVAIVFARSLLALTAPFLAALVLAALIDPLVDRLEQSGVPRAIGASGVLIACAAALAGATWILFANLFREAQVLSERLPEYAGLTRGALEEWLDRLDALVAGVPHPFDDALLEGAQQGVDLLGALATEMVSRARSIPSLLMLGVVTLTSTFFICRDKRELGDFLLHLLPARWHGEVRRIKAEITSGLLGFVRAQAILVAISGALTIAGLHLFGVRYAWILGTLAGILDIVPMVGPSGVFVPLIAWYAATGELTRGAGLAAYWLVVLLVRQVVEPQIVGRHVGLHPLTSIAAMYLGGTLLGINGLIAGPLIAIALKAVCVVSLLPYLPRR